MGWLPHYGIIKIKTPARAYRIPSTQQKINSIFSVPIANSSSLVCRDRNAERSQSAAT
jgi:hypothetical protein